MMPRPLLPSFPDARVILLRLSIVCLLVVTLAGCGGSDSGFTRAEIETKMSDALRDNVIREGGTMDQLRCVEDGDNLHWLCTAYVRLDDGLYLATVGITCDAETTDCISEQRGFTKQ